MSVANLWERTCTLLKEDTPSGLYNMWIAKLSPLRLDGDTLFLTADSAVTEKMISAFHRPMLNSALSEAAGQPMKVEIALPGEDEASFLPYDERRNNSTPLESRYTFESFVVGGANRFAYAASMAVAEKPAQAYNPLFIYGGVGLGKTHLMHAIGAYARQLYPSLEITYITSENFTNDLIASIQQNRNIEFRRRFRNVNILLVDDIQFIAGRDSTQEEFFHTFNALHSAGGQIVLTSDRPPRDIARLEERLRSRFEGGLICDVQRPDIETRIAILRRKAERDRLIIGDDILTMIAERIDSNIRELEGSLTRLMAFAALSGSASITMTMAEEALRETFLQREMKRTTCQSIQETVAHYYSITLEDLTGIKRSREVVVPRQIAMYLTREILGMSLPKIGDAFGGRDHSTVLNGCQKIQESIRKTPGFASVVNDIWKMIERQ
ncbi:MAG: chromosomal replication initiator protein DnaA [Clostridia bacterium]|nr:chromosomal replication initiator protein DnaA [Clostridia bacterium]